MSPRVFVMAGGGTGGHIIPGIAVARELAARGHRPLFIGTREGMEARLVPEAGFPIEWVEIGGMKGLSLARRARTVVELPASVWTARSILNAHNAAGVFSMGGYAAAPVVLAATLTGTPVVLMEANAMPGMTNRRMARFARRALVSFPEALPFFPAGRAELGGLPVRPEFFALPAKPRSTPPTVLITGGSRGSRTLNLAARALAGLPRPSLRILLQTGRDMHAELSAIAADGFEVVPFIEDMPRAFAQADLIVCRAGAGAVAELAAAGKPAVLVPYPYATDDHQMANARAMERAGAARVVSDKDMDGPRLLREITSLLEGSTLETMAAAARAQAKPGAAARAASLLEEYAAAKS
ncbi:MAG TPA: undecaprenyldiphospho-muramoylpentapeptide beta-N-acetylglucosaminyltransferase [Bryobacteraceae bacterium]|nr:undecaprenyldiphospho-muramoylpentapeptide beta-N-acetylglucosaminyltransferase [Bryobacteraceae bacterium]